jgi:hypothetical protein
MPINKNYCMSSYMAFRYIEKDDMDFYPGMHHSTNLSLSWKATGTLSTDALWDFYKYGLLCKSIDWKYQNEWRLVSCDNLLTDSSYNCRFFKIKKVYLGNRMPPEDRIKIIQICKDRGIPYAGVTIASDRFMMNDCAILCEDCEKVK